MDRRKNYGDSSPEELVQQAIEELKRWIQRFPTNGIGLWVIAALISAALAGFRPVCGWPRRARCRAPVPRGDGADRAGVTLPPALACPEP